MKYTNEVEIDLPLATVIKLLYNPENMKHWQPGLIKYEILTEKTGEVGSKIKLNFQMGKRQVEMIETITKKELPDIFQVTYDTQWVHNIVVNRFVAIAENKTRWITENEYQFTGLMMKMMGLVMPGSFKKQSQIYLDKFKEFAENSPQKYWV